MCPEYQSSIVPAGYTLFPPEEFRRDRFYFAPNGSLLEWHDLGLTTTHILVWTKFSGLDQKKAFDEIQGFMSCSGSVTAMQGTLLWASLMSRLPSPWTLFLWKSREMGQVSLYWELKNQTSTTMLHSAA